jgi:hypothetical protein
VKRTDFTNKVKGDTKMADWIFPTSADFAEAAKGARSDVATYVVVATHKNGRAPREWMGSKFFKTEYRFEDEKVAIQSANAEAKQLIEWGAQGVAVVKVPANVEISDSFIENLWSKSLVLRRVFLLSWQLCSCQRERKQDWYAAS